MAIYYSAEYTGVYITVPRVRRASDKNGAKQCRYWQYTQVANGADPDTIYTVKLPGCARLLLPECALWTEGCPAGTVYDWGFLGYTERDGDAVAAATDALLAGADPGADGLVFGGMNAAGTPDDQRPAVLSWFFDANAEVTLTITAKTSALQAGDVLRGYYTYLSP